MRVLFLAANPTTSTPLRLAAEQREIENRIASSERRADLTLTSVFAARPSDLLVQMNKVRPQILHFSGHGGAPGGIVLEAQDGTPKLVSPEALQNLFLQFKPELQVVVLNSCYSALQAKAFTEVVDAVVAMQDAVGDEAATTFAAAFYSALGFGRSIGEAFNQGRTAVMLEGMDGAQIPTLLSRPSYDPSKLAVSTSRSLMLSDDIKLPETLRQLLKSGVRLITIGSPSDYEIHPIYFEVLLRHSETTYVVEASRRLVTAEAAEEIAAAVVSSEAKRSYEWLLVPAGRPSERLVSYHTLEMAGIKTGDRVYLLGNHKRPEWAPSA